MQRFGWLAVVLCAGMAVMVHGENKPLAEPAVSSGQQAVEAALAEIQAAVEDAGDDTQRPDVRPVPLVDLAGEEIPLSASEKALRKALLRTVAVEFDQIALKDILKELQNAAEIPTLWIDDVSLKEEGISLDQPMTLSLGEVTLAQALHFLLEPHGLTWIIEDEIVKVTTGIKSDERFCTRAYDLGPLVSALQRIGVPAPKPKPNNWMLNGVELISPYAHVPGGDDPMAHFVELVQIATIGRAWDSFDGPAMGEIHAVGQTLLVRTVYHLQCEVEAALRAFEEAARGPFVGSAIPIQPWYYPVAKDAPLLAALRRKAVPCEFVDQPLHVALREYFRRQKLPCFIDEVSLEEEGVELTQPVSFSTPATSVRSAIVPFLESYGLTLEVRFGTIEITTQLRRDERKLARLYDIRDITSAGIDQAALVEAVGFIEYYDAAAVLWNGVLLVYGDEDKHRKFVKSLLDLRAAAAREGFQRVTRLDPADKVVATAYAAPPGTGAALAKALVAVVEPDSWKENGGTGVVEVAGDAVFVRNTQRVHAEISRLRSQWEWSREQQTKATKSNP